MGARDWTHDANSQQQDTGLDVRKKLPMEQEELAAKKALSSTADGEGHPQSPQEEYHPVQARGGHCSHRFPLQGLRGSFVTPVASDFFHITWFLAMVFGILGNLLKKLVQLCRCCQAASHCCCCHRRSP